MFRNDKNNFVSSAEKLVMKEEIQQDLESISQQVLAELPSGLLWEWDDRFDVPLLVFSREMEEEIWSVIERNFPHRWDINSIKTAPPTIRKLMDKPFGIQPEQSVLATDIMQDIFLFALWWPWGDGVTISLRISLAGKGAQGIDQEEKAEYLRQWFQP